MVLRANDVSDFPRRAAITLVSLLLLCFAQLLSAHAASDLKTYLPKLPPADLFSGPDRFGPPQGDPPIA
jgi:NosR/NirI family nitrous oxide reductase transcriptional regulator